MSTPNKSGSSELELDLDLHFLPAWAQRSSTENKYAKFEGGGDERERRDDRRGPPDQRRDRPPRRDPNRPRGPREGGERRAGGAPWQRHEGGYGGQRSGPRYEERREPVAPPVQLNVNFIPEEKGVEALARQIRLTGRAYPLFDIAHLILKKPDRYEVQFGVIKDAEGKVAQPLFLCELDETLWLSEQEAVNHVLDKHFATFYQSEKQPTDPPKGVYTFVAQCGMSGMVLGPPNYHDYQNKLRKLHAERFSRMPFEAFKSRVKIVKDEAVVKKWVEDQSFRTEYTCLNVPETIKLNSREEVEKHFRETHLPVVIKSVENYRLSGPAAQNQPGRPLQSLVRRTWDDQQRFPLKVVNTLSQQFASQGLHFFKVNKNVTHVAVARPRYLDMQATPVSDGIQKIVEFIGATPKCTRRKIVDALAPTPAAPAASLASATAAESGSAETPALPAGGEPQPSPEVAAINSDLHWLIHQGHVIEFANGIIELARKPPPKPPRPEPKPETKPAEGNAPAPAETETTASEKGSTELSIPTDTQAAVQGTVGAEPPVTDAAGPSLGSADIAGSGSMTSVPDSAVPAATPASEPLAPAAPESKPVPEEPTPAS